MEIREFVKTALIEVMSGVKDADAAVREIGGQVSPRGIVCGDNGRGFVGQVNRAVSQEPIVHLMQFEIAVDVREQTESGAGAKVSISVAGVSLGGTRENSNQHSSRMSFGVPVIYPGELARS